jgi:hypothetical protein
MRLFAKHLLIIVSVIIGLVITLGVAPKLISGSPKPGEPPSPEFLKNQQRVKMLSGTNLIIGVLILLVTTMLQV